jgi:hypothetical protein
MLLLKDTLLHDALDVSVRLVRIFLLQLLESLFTEKLLMEVLRLRLWELQQLLGRIIMFCVAVAVAVDML